jgi:hypothetical protein
MTSSSRLQELVAGSSLKTFDLNPGSCSLSKSKGKQRLNSFTVPSPAKKLFVSRSRLKVIWNSVNQILQWVPVIYQGSQFHCMASLHVRKAGSSSNPRFVFGGLAVGFAISSSKTIPCKETRKATKSGLWFAAPPKWKFQNIGRLR